ncbi:MAG: hypothetical protein IPK87_13770 [Planctomycetes bacterium]|nr:hypothetical protein [Planctomycetota bacterium]
MKTLSAIVLALCCVGVHAQDELPYARIEAALPYLSSSVPEQQLNAEQLVEQGASAHYEALEKALPGVRRPGRERLLRILADTDHARRIPMCTGMLCDRDAQRTERMIAWRALQKVRAEDLLKEIEQRLAAAPLDPYATMQLCALLGTLASARAQGVAEKLLEEAAAGSLAAFAAEDAALRSIFASSFAQPAWSRYQTRRAGAPKATLRELQDALDELALPRASDRAAADARLGELIGRDERVLLALARSPWVERAAFALRRLKADPPKELALAAQVVMLDLATTGEQTVALLAIDVGIAGRPPTADELAELRPVTGGDAIARLQAILEAMTEGGDLAGLRERNVRLSARLRPLLLRRGPMDAEARQLAAELQDVRRRLTALEQTWEQGWRREFQTDILSSRGN